MSKILKTVLIIILKVVGLLFLLSYERVIGLPFVFSFLGLVWLDKSQKKSYSRPLIILLLSFFMAIVYHAAWFTTIIVWFFSEVAINFQHQITRGKKRWFIILVLVQNVIWLWLLAIPTNFTLLLQLVISYALVVAWLKVLKPKRIKDVS